MRPDEQKAAKWLQLQGHTSIVYQSDDPPDFLVDGRYAVEVTRMQPPHETGGIPFERVIESVLKSLGPPNHHPGVIYVACDRPQPELPDPRSFQSELKRTLKGKLLQGNIAMGEMFSLNCGVVVSLWPSTQSGCFQYKLTDSSIGASQGEYLLPSLVENYRAVHLREIEDGQESEQSKPLQRVVAYAQ